MGSPTIFNGRYTKLLTAKGILNSDGSIVQFDGAKNYIPYAQFEQNATTGWSLFNTTLTSGLPTGTVGAGAASLALTTTAVNPLSGLYSLQVAAGTAWTAGQGVISSAFSVDRADLGKVLTFNISYEATVGATVANWSGVLGSQTLAVYLYDVTASAWVQPAGFLGMNQNSGSGRVTGTFQTSVTAGQQYQLAIVALQATASPVTITLDQVSCGPNTTPLGAAVTDWVAYTPTFTGFGTVATQEFYWRRVGANVEIRGKFVSGTSTATEARVSFPAGMTSSDTTRLNSIEAVGVWTQSTIGAISGYVLIEPSVSYLTLGQQDSARAGLTKQNGSIIAASGTSVSVIGSFPIQGWSSNVQVSNDTDTRVVDFVGNKTATQSVTANVTNITLSSLKDSHGAWSGDTYTVPVSGDYVVSGCLAPTGATSNSTYVFVNGVSTVFLQQYFSATSTTGTAFLYGLKAGDTINFRQDATTTISSGASVIRASIHRLSGPSVIAATESVNASYYVSATFAASTTTPVNFDSKEFDSHNAVTTSATAWKFTAPVSGLYSVTLIANIGTGSFSWHSIYKNGVLYKGIATGSSTTNAFGTGLVRLNAGEYVDIRPQLATSYTGGALSAALITFFQISRVGN
jgi:hypothetical protein